MGLIAKPVHREVAADGSAIDEAVLAAFGCDVAFISDDSVPADMLVSAAVEQTGEPEIKHLLWAVFERLRGKYESGKMLSHPSRVLAHVRQSAAAGGIELTHPLLQPLLPFFDRVNRVVFAHQTLGWLIGSDLKICVYGTGWDQNPTFMSLARGPIESAEMRRAIWHASRINLATGPYGAVSERVLDGVGAGAFFLMRFCPADVIERFYPPIADFCRIHGITTTIELRSLATRGLRRLIGYASRTLGMDILGEWPDFVPHVLHVTSTARARSAAAIWSSYPAVCFHSRDELLAQCTRYLYDGPERRRLADEMRRQLADAARRVSVTVNGDLLSRRIPAAGGQDVAA